MNKVLYNYSRENGVSLYFKNFFFFLYKIEILTYSKCVCEITRTHTFMKNEDEERDTTKQ